MQNSIVCEQIAQVVESDYFIIIIMYQSRKMNHSQFRQRMLYRHLLFHLYKTSEMVTSLYVHNIFIQVSSTVNSQYI